MGVHVAGPTSFKPGQSGNPKGRIPKGYSITEWFKNMMNSNPEVKEALGKAITKKALEGDAAAQRLIWNYMDGMPKQTITANIRPIPLLSGISDQQDALRPNNSPQQAIEVE